MKKLKWIVGIFVLVLAVAAVALWLWLDAIIKTTVETVGPRVLGVPVTLGHVRLAPLRGRVILKDLEIGNPEGFRAAHLFKLAEMDVDLDMSSLFGRTLRFSTIHVIGPDVIYEQSLKGNNFSKLLDGLEQPAQPDDKPTDAAPADKPDGKPRKIIIDHFLFDEARLRVQTPVPGAPPISLPLPGIELFDVGKDKGGAGLRDILRQIFRGISGAVTGVISGSSELLGQGLSVSSDLATEGVRALGDAAGAGAKTVEGAATEGARAIGEGVDRAVSGLGRMLPGRRESEEK
ncbi:MAG: hypothetical protein ABR497_01360 [Kiritimatiellia bacterium]|nr:hypothetical protein [Lentisphaerota bacterium]